MANQKHTRCRLPAGGTLSVQHVERESFLKSFLLFFLSMGGLSALLYWGIYAKALHNHDEQLLTQMRLCSFDLTCKEFTIDFVAPDQGTLYTLQRDQAGLYALFPISQSAAYVLQLRYDAGNYSKDITAISKQTLRDFFLALLLIGLLSALFSFYALHPLRRALLLTREFVRDILHDFNTPLSVLRLNTSLLQKELGEHTKLTRMEQAISTIVALQENLRGYLESHPQGTQQFDLKPLLQERMALVEKLYPQLDFSLDATPLMLTCNRDALSRILDNLLSNAAKYNRPEGEVTLKLDGVQLHISDTGSGIREPEKIFRRFYTETPRGVGIGLHIVRKFCDAMGITVAVRSEAGKGSTFTLDLSALTQR